jgi:hypothetical protein
VLHHEKEITREGVGLEEAYWNLLPMPISGASQIGPCRPRSAGACPRGVVQLQVVQDRDFFNFETEGGEIGLRAVAGFGPVFFLTQRRRDAEISFRGFVNPLCVSALREGLIRN